VSVERTGLHRRTASSGEAQCPREGPAANRSVQAFLSGMHRRSPPGESAPGIGYQGTRADDDTQQFGDRRAFPAAHTGAHRDRRFGHPAL
jgi:hypothetical protein